MRSLTIYFSRNNQSHTELIKDIRELSEKYGLIFLDICVDGDTELEERFKSTPVILIGPYHLNGHFSLSEVEVAIKSVMDKDQQEGRFETEKKQFSLTPLERFSFWFSRSYVWVISLIILMFVSVAFIPPVLVRSGYLRHASSIYKMYSVLCHQLGYRSFYLFGEQAFYPRELAGMNNLITFEQITEKSANDLNFARDAYGNSEMGYKVALCQRDVAIYIALGIFGIGFELSGKKMKPLKWYYWFLFALLPIALDGFSQLPGLSEGWPAWLPQRESTPYLRVITGFLFGSGTAWYMYPLMEESIKETRFQLGRKQAIFKRLRKK